MSSFTNNGTFGWEDDRGPSGHHTSTSRQQYAPIIGNSSCSELHWTGEPRRESYVPTGIASTTSSWPSAAFLDPRFSVYGGGVLSGDQRLDEARLGPLFSAPGGNADGPRTNLLMGMGVMAPVLEQAFPVVQRALPASQPCLPPALNWTQALGPPWRPSSSWDHPVRTARPHGGHSSSISSLGTRPEVPRFRLAADSVITGHSERRVVPTGRLPLMATSHSVLPPTHSDPVPVASSPPRPRGERWDLSSNTTTFQCRWRSGGTRCTALIAGDRRSVTSHLRDEHHFACDGQTIACAWGQCTACMQRRNIPRHIVACHFEIKVTCSQCGMALSRADANRKHRLACTGVKTPAAVEVGEGDDGRLFFF